MELKKQKFTEKLNDKSYCLSRLAIAIKPELSASLGPRSNSSAWCGSYTGIFGVWDREL